MKNKLKYKCLSVTIFAVLTFLLPCFAQEDTPEEYIVKVVYFVSKDREHQKDMDTKIRKLLKDTQKFYADQMENYGYGRKTFRLETDADGKTVVHHVIGIKEGKEYQQDLYQLFGEFANRIQTRSTILFVVVDHGFPTVGGAGGLTYPGSRILVPASSFFWLIVAHELGHTFGLPHDFRSGSYVMSYGPGPQNMISQCAAQWLNVNPYFNSERILANEPGQVKMLPLSIAYPPNDTHAFFEITDPDGLYQMRFLHYNTLLGCETLNGEKDIVRISANTTMDESILVWVVDVNGYTIDRTWHSWYSLKDLEPHLILDISGDVTDVPDRHNIRGPWLWMIAPTEQNQGGANSTHIDSLAVASANTVNEEQVSKYGANKGDIVGDDSWTPGEVPPDGNINTMLVNIGMTEDTNLDDFTAYALITLVSKTDQPNVTMSVRSDDSIKVWLNGEVVWRNAINRSLYEGVDAFPVNLKKGDNLLLMKVSEKNLAWGMQVGIDAEVFPVYRTVPTTAPVYGVALGGTCDLTPEIINEGADIEYIITVINTGNTKDTINLATSGNTTYLRRLIELEDDDLSTQTTFGQVTLEPGASSKMALVVPGFVRATAGEYVVNVTATSESDSTKTAQIKTHATIKPFHGVTLSAVDDLTIERDDVKTDIQYTLIVTNTGNVDDTIRMTTELPATLSRNSVLLVPGASSKVTLTIPATAGAATDDSIHVIATSEGDSTKTDQIQKTYGPRPNIQGPWLWMIAPTAQYRGGKDSTDIDSLAVASADKINETTVAKVGASEKDTVGDYTWTLSEMPPDGNINAMLFNIGMAKNTNYDDFTAYAFITLVSKTDQPHVEMKVRSDDSIKVWLNGEVVWRNAINRSLYEGVDAFPVNLKKGDNLLLVKVSERHGAWGMQVGVDAEVLPVYRRVPAKAPVYGVAIEEISNLTTEASDVTSGIKYILKVTNTGNTKDTIRLATSGTIPRLLSQPSVWLAPGASSKVMLTIPPTAFTAVGNYEVKVTATSESDSTKTDQITTKTTITIHANITILVGVYLAWDVNQDGRVSPTDLVLVARDFGSNAPANLRTDVNRDGEINIIDLLLVASHFGETTDSTNTDAAAPKTVAASVNELTPELVQAWIDQAQVENDESIAFQQGIANLQKLLASLLPEKTILLANYPNPFNPETWIPYHLAKPADVTLTIYTANGNDVRTLALGHQAAGIYQSRSRAAHWDGKNGVGESVASGIYFYTLVAEHFTETRKMLIIK